LDHKRKIHGIIIAGMLIIVFIISACGLSSFNNKTENGVEATPTDDTNRTAQMNEAEEGENSEVEALEMLPTPETITVMRMDGTEEIIPVVYSSGPDLLEAKIASGDWDEGEGLVMLLKYLTGEMNRNELKEADLVIEFNGTGLVRWAQNYLGKEVYDEENKSEITRLLAKLFPDQSVLDKISSPENPTSHQGRVKTAMLNQQSTPAECQSMAENGFGSDYIAEGACYVEKKIELNGNTHMLYYPSSWQGDEEKQALVEHAATGLTDSVLIYTGFGKIHDINMMFSLLPDTDNPNTLAFESQTDKGATCPLTLLPGASASSAEIFKQTIAHEVFHCFQDWNFTTEPYDSNAWWLEGSSEYFSNVVYPTVNDEHVWKNRFDLISRNKSLQDMKYENFIFFQHAANTYGDNSLIELLRTLGAGGGAASSLAGYQKMSATFQEFVVGYLSQGIMDNDGSMIYVENPVTTGEDQINKEREAKYSTSSFVVTRYLIKYKKELRFLQDPQEDGDGKYSTVLFKERQDPSKWSALPPELRSTCKEDIKYMFALSSTTSSTPYKFTANVNKVEEASCDPCLLGVWQVDNVGFAEYIMALSESQGGMEGLPPGSQLAVDIQGDYLLEFKEDSELTTRRNEFTIQVGITDQEGFSFTTVIDSQGSGQYSTTDGEILKLMNLTDYVNKAQGFVNGAPISVTLTPGGGTYSMFGATAAGPGYENKDDGPDSMSASYTCDQETFVVTHPEYGDLLFNRVEKIMPTPIPTLMP
jgi:hypothetical protein